MEYNKLCRAIIGTVGRTLVNDGGLLLVMREKHLLKTCDVHETVQSYYWQCEKTNQPLVKDTWFKQNSAELLLVM